MLFLSQLAAVLAACRCPLARCRHRCCWSLPKSGGEVPFGFDAEENICSLKPPASFCACLHSFLHFFSDCTRICVCLCVSAAVISWNWIEKSWHFQVGQTKADVSIIVSCSLATTVRKSFISCLDLLLVSSCRGVFKGKCLTFFSLEVQLVLLCSFEGLVDVCRCDLVLHKQNKWIVKPER